MITLAILIPTMCILVLGYLVFQAPEISNEMAE